MNVLVFTTSVSLRNAFKAVDKSRSFTIHTEDPKRFRKTLTALRGNTLIYLDASQFSETQITRALKDQTIGEQVRIGIVDKTGIIEDPASLFQQGAVDYLPKALLQRGITATRLKKAVSFCDFTEVQAEEPATTQEKADWILSGTSWSGIKSGNEYTFCLMYVEIDLIDEWKNKSGSTHLDEVKAAFHQHMEQFADEFSGKIWMWMDLYGLILFPFDGKKCDQIIECMRLILNRTIISAEKYNYTTTISYTLVLHIGNTIYKSRGNTGTIVSDTVNFLFHTGHQFAEPGNLYLTEPVHQFIPQCLADCFLSSGTFEGVSIRRMRSVVTQGR